ncbi:phospholipase D-like domain-containing protein [Kocuria turfanensis]|uniref:PLD phosphodiesterase domain-containing protein n=1 Tax=Kocuria turfanensis TaxID=388357 RepID=A0A512IGC1_9MICC|nr:phospholipase D-like domain-containing protein [Kocuria turfanensis]GEO96728.1 hypothetical protein KTU01_28510 [Kocuria turfanensis]
MGWAQLVAVALVLLEYGLKLVAVGTVPENRRPSSSSAWLLLILYSRALPEAGVHIHLYPAPAVLHAKYLTVDDTVAMIGSSNMDFRSFALDYEVMLLAFGGDLVAELQANAAHYRAISRELTLEEWRGQPWHHRYLDNVCRLVSALM